MKNLAQIIGVLLLVFFGCSRNYPTEADIQNTSPKIDEQVSLAKTGNNDLLKVFRTERSPIIDGKRDEPWQNVPNIRLRLYIDEPNPIDGPRDLSAFFQIMWDDNSLYVFYDVKDEEINVSNPDPWYNDCMEIFLDGDNSKNDLATGYDSNDDQLRFVFGEGPTNTYDHIDVSAFDVAYRQGKNGYTIEAALPFAVLPFPPTKGHIFGFETHVADNDLGARQNLVRWWSIENAYNTWQDASLMGTAILAGKHDDD